MISRSAFSFRSSGWLWTFFVFAGLNFSLPAQEFRAFWVDAWGPGFKTAAEVTQLISDARAANCNALIVQVRRRGDAFYNNSPYEPKTADTSVSPPSFDPLADLIAKAHNTNTGPRIEIHTWIVTYNIWNNRTTPPSQPDHPYNLHPDWLTKSSTGATWDNSNYAFDPAHPEVQKHTFNVAMDIISRYDVDGFNFDYIRYAGSAWGYNDVAVARFNQKHGRTGQPASSDELWRQFRRDQVTALVRKVYLSAIAIKPHVKISADTITWAWQDPVTHSAWTNYARAWTNNARAYYDVLQDWRSWMEEGILDLNIPMAYFDQNGSYMLSWTNWNVFAKDRRFNRHLAMGPGIYMNTISNSLVQMRHVRTLSPSGNAANGIALYSYRVTNKDNNEARTSFLNALVQPSGYDPVTPPIFAQPATPPVMPWKTAPTQGHLKGFVNQVTNAAGWDGATVTLSGPVNKTMITDATGFYGAVDLPPGNYAVTATFPGLGSNTANIAIAAGMVTTQNLSLPASNQPPAIVSQPQSQTVNAGANVTFSVTANGSGSLSYQWRFNGQNILGASSNTCALTQVDTNDAGDYSVVVTNAFGSVTSAVATLTVIVPPSITVQPQDQAVNAGGTATFSVTATGTAPFSYRWRFNGTTIAGANSATLTLINVQPADAGGYTVVITNLAGFVVSSNATLTVLPPSPIFNVVPTPGSRNAIISWSTTLPATSQVEFGASTNYGMLTRFDAEPVTLHSVLLTGLRPDTVYFFRVISIAGAITYRSDGSSFTTAGTVVIDNVDASFTGTWSTGTMSPDKYSTNYGFASTVSGAATLTARFAPNLATPGHYDVYVWYPQGSNRSTNAPHTVVFDGGSVTLNLNQTNGGGDWRLLAADKPFAVGTNGYVQIANDTGESGKVVMADAVRFVYSAGQEPPATGSAPYWWISYHFGSNVNALADHDGDGYATWTEYCLGTCPTSAASRLNLQLDNAAGLRAVFSPFFADRTYQLQSLLTLASNGWLGLSDLPLNVISNGQAAVRITNATNAQSLYRLKVDWAP